MTRSDNDDVCVEGGEPFQRFLPVGRDLRVKVTIGKHGGQGATLALVIIDDEDPARNRRLLGHHDAYLKCLEFIGAGGEGQGENSL